MTIVITILWREMTEIRRCKLVSESQRWEVEEKERRRVDSLEEQKVAVHLDDPNLDDDEKHSERYRHETVLFTRRKNKSATWLRKRKR